MTLIMTVFGDTHHDADICYIDTDVDSDIEKRLHFTVPGIHVSSSPGNVHNSQDPVLTNPVPDLISRQVAPPCVPPMTHLDVGPYSSVGLDDTFPPPPSPLVVRKEYSRRGEFVSVTVVVVVVVERKKAKQIFAEYRGT